MTAAELLRTALERKHRVDIDLASPREQRGVALRCMLERQVFENEVADGVWGPGHEVAVFALAGVDP